LNTEESSAGRPAPEAPEPVHEPGRLRAESEYEAGRLRPEPVYESGPLQRRALRRISLRILPFIMLLYVVAFLDRVNLGFASLSMNRDLGLSPAAFGLGAGIFFIGYLIFEIPSNLMLHKLGARIWIARVMITWALASGAMAFVRGQTSFFVLRFLLGVAEAGFFPGIILYLSYWFPRRGRAAATSLFMAAAPISVAVGSPISAALLQVQALGMKGWQWLFLIEAAPALLLGLVTLVFLTDRPQVARWLPDDERTWLVQTIAAERTAPEEERSNPLRALADSRVLALALVYFGTSAGLYTLGIWSPQIISAAGLSTGQTGIVNALPPAIGVIAMVLWARHSDRSGERTMHVVAPCLLAAAGLAMAASAVGVVAVVAALIVVNVGISAAKPPLWSMPTLFLSGSGAAAGIAAINSIGNLGGFFGPAIIGWIKQRSGGFGGGLCAVALSLILSALLVQWLGKSSGRAPLAAK
jgi:ACS family tartrate transporter-like MFS transporter